MHAGAYLHDCLPPCMHACLHTCMHRYEYIHASLTSESGMHAFIHPCLHSSMHEQLDLPVWICMYGYAILCMHRKCSMVILKAFRASLVLSTKLETQQQKSCSATSGWDMSAYRAAGQPKISVMQILSQLYFSALLTTAAHRRKIAAVPEVRHSLSGLSLQFLRKLPFPASYIVLEKTVPTGTSHL